MSTTDRRAGHWTPLLSSYSLDARIQLVPRLALGAIALVMTVAVGGGLCAGSRLAALDGEAYPALVDARTLAATLVEVQGELTTGGSGAAHDARLDSLTQRFHVIAHRDHEASLSGIDARFSDYLSQARTSALGRAAGADATARSQDSAEQSYRVLNAELAAKVRGAERSMTSSLAETRDLQSVVLVALLAAGALAIGFVATLAWAMRSSVSSWIDGVAGTVDALSAGDYGIPIRDSAEDAPGRLSAALRRMTRQLHDNAETAQALADGSYRRAARTRMSYDPTGVALGRLTATMTELATASQRVARGDLTVMIAPHSPDDAFGEAYAAMMRRVVGTLEEVDATRATMLALIEAMRGDAAALASSANIDAERLRRTEERLTGIALQARADVTRGTLLAERTDESESLLESGSVALQSSIEGLASVLRSAEAVQHLARQAGLLAVRGAVTSGAPEADAVQQASEARLLATEAAAAAGTITRIMIGGTDNAYAAGVALDRVAIAVRDSATLVRELGTASQRRAVELTAIDEAVSQVSRTTSNSAETARQIVLRLDSLASHARRLQIVGRRGMQGRAPSIGVTTGAAGAMRTHPALTAAAT